jgi:hypothetical protein
MSKTPRELIASLEHLTPFEIACTLDAAGFVGVRKSDCLCPLAVWLRLETGDHCRVGCNVVEVCGSVHSRNDMVRMPSSVRMFVHEFDNGLFPWLELESKGA